MLSPARRVVIACNKFIVSKRLLEPSLLYPQVLLARRTKHSSQVLPEHGDVVVCGSGIVGCSVAYLLAKRGNRDIILIDEQRHEIAFAKLSHWVYQEAMDKVSGWDWCEKATENFDRDHHPKGSFTISTTQNRATENMRKKALLTAADIRCEIVDSGDMLQYFPSINSNDIINALWVPQDDLMDPSRVHSALLEAGIRLGVQYIPGCRVEKVTTGPSRRAIPKVTGVQTHRGYIETSIFVNCAGPWSAGIGLDSPHSLNICVGPCVVSSLTTQEIKSRDVYPYLFCDPDSGAWMVHDKNRITIISANTGVSVFQETMPSIMPEQGITPCPDHMQRALESVTHRFPALQGIEPHTITSAFDSYCYDHNIAVGELETVLNYFVVSGMRGQGLMFGGAAAHILQSLLYRNRSEFNLHFCSPSRYAFTNSNELYRQARTAEISMRNMELCETDRDFQFYQTCRGNRVSPLFDILKSNKAVFGSQYGFEWPLFFDKDKNIDINHLVFSNLYREPHYAEIVKKEYLACKQNLGIADMSGFVKVFVESSSAAVLQAFMERIFCTPINYENMAISRALALNSLGTYECDVILTRLDANRFLLVGPCLQTVHLPAWLNRQILLNEQVTVTDVSSRYGVLNLIGPMASLFLDVVCGRNPDGERFLSTKAQLIDVDVVSDVIAMRVSYSGEDGFTLFVPSEKMPLLYNRLIAHGTPFGIQNVGYLAIRTLRIEHSIDYWGSEVSQRVTPIECNKGHLIKMDRGNFKGRGAIMDAMSHGMLQRLISFKTKVHSDRSPWPAEGDPIYEGDTVRGYITCSAYSFEQKKHVCLGFLMDKEAGKLSNPKVRGRKFEIDICNDRLELIPFS